MKKAFTSVFKNKTANSRVKDSESGSTSSSSITIEDLKTLDGGNTTTKQSVSLSASLSSPPPKMAQSSNNNDRCLPPIGKSSINRIKRFSGEETSEQRQQSPQITSISNNIGKNDTVQSTVTIESPRLNSISKGKGLTLVCQISSDTNNNNNNNNYDSDGPEPIITTPQSPNSGNDSSPSSPPSLKYDLVKTSLPQVISPANSGYLSESSSICKKSEGKLIKSREVIIEQGKNIESRYKSNDQRLTSEISSSSSSSSKYLRGQEARQIKTGESVSTQSGVTKSSEIKVNSESVLQQSSSSSKGTYKSQKSISRTEEKKNITSTTSSMSSTRFVKSTHLSSAITSSSSSSSSSRATLEGGEMNALEFDKSQQQSIDMSLQLMGLNASDEKFFITQNSSDCDNCTLEVLPNHLISKVIGKFSNLIENLKENKENNDKILADLNSIVYTSASKRFTNDDSLYKKLCDLLRTSNVIDILIDNCGNDSLDCEIRYQSGHLLEQTFTHENLSYVVDKGLPEVVNLACDFAKSNLIVHERTGTGILSKLFTISEETCKDVIKKGGLKAIIYKCRSTDAETLRHCASALANLAVYGGPENHSSMINEKAPAWLFPLARQNDEDTAYYACLAIATLSANKEIEASVSNSGTLQLIKWFISTHSPEDFIFSILHSHGQSKEWLKRFASVLESDREEARSLAAFHFAAEAYIKAKQGKETELREIGVVDLLKKVASSPNATVAKLARQALKTLHEQVPHKLSQQVPLWTVKDVVFWVRQIGFEMYEKDFVKSQVDGDLLLQLTEPDLRNDLKIENGILRKRFLRELEHLKRITDYSSCDTPGLFNILQSLGKDYPQYTYSMLQAGVDSQTIKMLDEEQLVKECKISNSIHRFKIVEAINNLTINDNSDEFDSKKSLDAFISYRRSSGSQLASLLKVHLQLKGFSVFIDIERLEAGKFDSNVLSSIKQAKNFLLVLTPNALDRCRGDDECKDWVHKEIQTALESKCKIIPIIDNFQWPEAESLPEDMRSICYFNGVRWIHEYQDACVDKLERFMRNDYTTTGKGHHHVYPGTPIKSFPRAGSTDGLKSPPDHHNQHA